MIRETAYSASPNSRRKVIVQTPSFPGTFAANVALDNMPNVVGRRGINLEAADARRLGNALIQLADEHEGKPSSEPSSDALDPALVGFAAGLEAGKALAAK